MDFYRFVNSKDIREHLRSIGYEFTSLEAAWLVHRCRDATMFEKIDAWGYIIKNMPDCEVTVAREPCEHFMLHGLLGKYIYEYDCLLHMILRRQNYTFEVLDKDNNVVYENNYIYRDTSNIRIIVHDRYKESKEQLYCRIYADYRLEHRNNIVELENMTV